MEAASNFEAQVIVSLDCESVKVVGTGELVIRGAAEDVPSAADLADYAMLGSDAPDLNR